MLFMGCYLPYSVTHFSSLRKRVYDFGLQLGAILLLLKIALLRGVCMFSGTDCLKDLDKLRTLSDLL